MSNCLRRLGRGQDCSSLSRNAQKVQFIMLWPWLTWICCWSNEAISSQPWLDSPTLPSRDCQKRDDDVDIICTTEYRTGLYIHKHCCCLFHSDICSFCLPPQNALTTSFLTRPCMTLQTVPSSRRNNVKTGASKCQEKEMLFLMNVREKPRLTGLELGTPLGVVFRIQTGPRGRLLLHHHRFLLESGALQSPFRGATLPRPPICRVCKRVESTVSRSLSKSVDLRRVLLSRETRFASTRRDMWVWLIQRQQIGIFFFIPGNASQMHA